MADGSGIEWTDATWNPVTGCTKVSPGCDHCYAERVTERFHGRGSFATVQMHPDRLDRPLRWRKPRKVFVNSMSDLFHADVPDEFIARVFAVMAASPHHTFQVLTKRHARMRSLLSSTPFKTSVADLVHVDTGAYKRYLNVWPLPNVWVGVSVEDQHWADIRVPALADTPAAVRWLSCEPLLGPLDLTPWLPDAPMADLMHGGGILAALVGRCDLQPTEYGGSRHVARECRNCTNGRRISWVVVGGESGPGARPMHPGWARSLRDQCAAAGVPFLFKQWGEWVPVTGDPRPGDVWVFGDGKTLPWSADNPPQAGAAPGRWDPYGDVLMRRVGKKAAGRVLDGRTWDKYPERSA